MSKYTTQLRWIIENATKNNTDLSIYERIDLSRPNIFDFPYPIWNEEYRPILERKILSHYFNKEIGFETVGLWKFYLNERLNLIMPYYNKLYATTVKDYDWLADTNSKELYVENKKKKENVTLKNHANSESNATTNNSDKLTENVNTDENVKATGKNLRSDLPQANYKGLDYGTELNESDSTTTTHTEQNTTSDRTGKETTNAISDTIQTSENTVENNQDNIFTRTHLGANGSHTLTSLLVEYRDSLINIDKMVIDELHDLFLLLY